MKNTYMKMKIERKITTIEIHTIAIIKNAKDGSSPKINGPPISFHVPNPSMFYRKCWKLK